MRGIRDEFLWRKIYTSTLLLCVIHYLVVLVSAKNFGEDEEDENHYLGSHTFGCGLTVKNATDDRQLAPWVAGIFQKVANQWVYLCGATIIYPHVVITAASCVLDQSEEDLLGNSKRRHLRYSTLRVLAGMRTTDYNDRDQFTQELFVFQIREHQPPILDHVRRQEIYLQQSNLAGVLATAPFNYTDYVRPACVVEIPNSIPELLTTAPGQKVMLAGFDVSTTTTKTTNKKMQNETTPSKLSIHHLTLLSRVECAEKIIKAHGSDFSVICGGPDAANTTNTPIPCDMEGHGMMARTNGFKTGVGPYFVMAVYTANSARPLPNPDPYLSQDKKSVRSCGSRDDVIFFTTHGQLYRWAVLQGYCDEDVVQCLSTSCVAPGSLCNGPAQCEDKSDESWEVCSAQKDACADQEFRCDYGACVQASLECDGKWDCADGSDEKNLTKCRQLDAIKNITCPPFSDRADVKATCRLPTHLRGHEIKCDGSDGPIPVETEMTVKCARYYLPKLLHKTNQKSPSTQGSNYGNDPEEDGKEDNHGQEVVTCSRTGNWSKSVKLRCRADCGISQAKKDAYVIGGQVVAAKYRSRYPWIASIFQRWRGRKEFHFTCGGTLISPNVVLTAAHCVTRGDANSKFKDLSQFKVFFGKITSNINERDEHTQELGINATIIKENYNPNSFEGDLALLILDGPVVINDHVRPACVPNPEDYELTENLLEMANPNNGTILGTVVGFGNDETHMASVQLKRLKMPVVPKRQCQEYLKTINFHIYISETWLCAGHTNGSAVCEGDSGSGLVLPYASYGTKQYFVQGIVSHGPNLRNETDPCSSKSYKIFTKTQSFSAWIHRYLDEYQVEDDEPQIDKEHQMDEEDQMDEDEEDQIEEEDEVENTTDEGD